MAEQQHDRSMKSTKQSSSGCYSASASRPQALVCRSILGMPRASRVFRQPPVRLGKQLLDERVRDGGELTVGEAAPRRASRWPRSWRCMAMSTRAGGVRISKRSELEYYTAGMLTGGELM